MKWKDFILTTNKPDIILNQIIWKNKWVSKKEGIPNKMLIIFQWEIGKKPSLMLQVIKEVKHRWSNILFVKRFEPVLKTLWEWKAKKQEANPPIISKKHLWFREMTDPSFPKMTEINYTKDNI